MPLRGREVREVDGHSAPSIPNAINRRLITFLRIRSERRSRLLHWTAINSLRNVLYVLTDSRYGRSLASGPPGFHV